MELYDGKQNSVPHVSEACVLCGACLLYCPNKAISVSRSGVVIDPLRCTGCGICVHRCFRGAITGRQE